MRGTYRRQWGGGSYRRSGHYPGPLFGSSARPPRRQAEQAREACGVPDMTRISGDNMERVSPNKIVALTIRISTSVGHIQSPVVNEPFLRLYSNPNHGDDENERDLRDALITLLQPLNRRSCSQGNNNNPRVKRSQILRLTRIIGYTITVFFSPRVRKPPESAGPVERKRIEIRACPPPPQVGTPSYLLIFLVKPRQSPLS